MKLMSSIMKIYIKEHKRTQSKLVQAPDCPYRILFIGGSGSDETSFNNSSTRY